MPPSLAALATTLTFAGALAAAAAAMPAPPPGAAPALVLIELRPDTAATDRRQRMDRVHNWGYWLSSIVVDAVAAAPHDLLVIDSEVSANRSFEREYTPEEVARMQRRPDGSRRVLLAYLSIGEAEQYRPYWQADWSDPAKRPAWLGGENHRWVGNFAVQYWDPEWQRLIFGAPEAYLDRIMAQGFDGVYLDRADAFFEWRKLHPSAQADMASFLARLSDYARKHNPQFLIVMQNAEELLEDAQVLDAIDGIAKEDLLFGIRHAEEPNSPEDIAWSVQLLRLAQRAGRKVFVVEYLKDPDKIASATQRISAEGFVPYFAPRRLDCLNPPVDTSALGNLPEQLCR